MPADHRSKKVWKQLSQGYGARFTDSYGPTVSDLWSEAVDTLTDEQLQHGLRIVMHESPIHPPTLGQFTAACANMPIAQIKSASSIQEQLCEYAARKLIGLVTRGEISHLEYSRPWTYVYRESWDATRPKGMERCAECVGVVIEFLDGTWTKYTVEQMHADGEEYARVLQSFSPRKAPDAAQMRAIAQRAASIAKRLPDAR